MSAMACRAFLAMLLTGVIGCALFEQNVDCRLGARCDAVLEAANAVVPLRNARVVIVADEGSVFTPRSTPASRMVVMFWSTSWGTT